jgi:hypothetical protein
MARPTRPRSDRQHEVIAGNVILKHEMRTGAAVEFPVPIEMIIEQSYGLEILWDEIDEPPGTMILGALAPNDMRIVLNTRHEQLFERHVGPLQFTLAHELGHWLYDAEAPGQQQLDLAAASNEQFCYHRESPGLSDTLALREVNANKLASHILMPAHLVKQLPPDEILDDLRATARKWGVSLTALWYRLVALDLVDESEATDFGIDWV